MKIVVDTNVLLSGIFWRGSPRKILDLWAQKKVNLVVSVEILTEYTRVIESFADQKDDVILRRHWIDFIVNNVVIVKTRKTSFECRDPDDKKFIDCAIAGKAACLITGDKDLLCLKDDIGITILKPNDFLRKMFL